MCSRPSKDQDRAMRYAEAASGKPAPSTQHMRRNVEPTSPQGVRPKSKDTPMNYLRTAILLAGLTPPFIGGGGFFGGGRGARIAPLLPPGLKPPPHLESRKPGAGAGPGPRGRQEDPPPL